jgi:hypothetical protein
MEKGSRFKGHSLDKSLWDHHFKLWFRSKLKCVNKLKIYPRKAKTL